MAEIDDGGPAFPSPYAPGQTTEGLTKRDWFAGQALAGMMANEEAYAGVRWDLIAANAYLAADAMIAAKRREGGR